MRIVVYVPLAVCVLAALSGPMVARRLPPRTATWWLTGTAVAAAAAWCTALALLAFTAVGQLRPVAAEGHWSTQALRADNPVDPPVAVGAGLILLTAAVTLAITTYRRLGALARARRLCGTVWPQAPLVVLNDPAPQAFAVPGAAGRVVVSTGLLRTLNAAERRALLAHEHSHLRHRHHLHLTAVRLAAAACPLLYPLFRAAIFTVERWADEDAAGAVGDRRLVARTLGKAALAALKTPAAALALATCHVPRRMQALLAPPPGQRRLVIIAGVAFLALTCLSLREATHDTERLFEAAKHAYRALGAH